MRAVRMASSIAMFMKALCVSSGNKRQVSIFVSAFRMKGLWLGLNLLWLKRCERLYRSPIEKQALTPLSFSELVLCGDYSPLIYRLNLRLKCWFYVGAFAFVSVTSVAGWLERCDLHGVSLLLLHLISLKETGETI
jgi:hypothetical protein